MGFAFKVTIYGLGIHTSCGYCNIVNLYRLEVKGLGEHEGLTKLHGTKSTSTMNCLACYVHVDGASIQLDSTWKMLPKATIDCLKLARMKFGVTCMNCQK
jgi:hypothetical protein